MEIGKISARRRSHGEPTVWELSSGAGRGKGPAGPAVTAPHQSSWKHKAHMRAQQESDDHPHASEIGVEVIAVVTGDSMGGVAKAWKQDAEQENQINK